MNRRHPPPGRPAPAGSLEIPQVENDRVVVRVQLGEHVPEVPGEADQSPDGVVLGPPASGLTQRRPDHVASRDEPVGAPAAKTCASACITAPGFFSSRCASPQTSKVAGLNSLTSRGALGCTKRSCRRCTSSSSQPRQVSIVPAASCHRSLALTMGTLMAFSRR